MGAHSDRITQLDALIAESQKQIDWIEGNSNSWDMYFGDPQALQESFTGAGGDAYYSQWRTANPSASDSSTGYELEIYTQWKHWSDNGSDLSTIESTGLAELKTQVANFNTEKSNVQAKIDAGYTGDETAEEAHGGAVAWPRMCTCAARRAPLAAN